MSKKIFSLIVLVLVFGAAACAKQPLQKPGQQTPQAGQPAEPKNVIGAVYTQWQNSAHATAVDADNPQEAPGLREQGNCFKCHNGYAFERNAQNLEGIGILKGTSCDACHTGYGQQLVTTGAVQVPIGDLKAGKGSLCIACHSGRGKKPDQSSAPHGSVQADVLFSKSGSEVEGFTYGKSKHATAPDSCLACHGVAGNDGVKEHSFKMKADNIANSCGKCHKDYNSFNPTSKADYDGDGSKKGYQDEVTGLLKVLESAINQKLEGGKFTSGGGKINFVDASGNALEKAPDEKIYNAAWNYMLVTNDGSKGIHNPTYSIQLLQQSYKNLTGQDVPKAEIRK